MTIKFKKLHDKANNPYKKHLSDLGWDLTAVSMNIINAPDHGYIEYDTGWAVEIPVGFGGFIFPRSSISNTGLILANCIGVIDP
jgi:dUTPase